jgi:soluble lytic murein transglycosylase-like protein
VRKVAIAAVAALLAAGSTAGQRLGGVVIFTAPDGSRRVVNVPASSSGKGSVPAGVPERRTQLWPAVEQTARTHGLDPTLVDLVIRMESGYNPRALSRRGARGVMQLMPETADLYGVRNPFDPLQNIRGGVRYLSDLMHRFDFDVSRALAAYNAGPEAVERHGGVPPYDETRAYVRNILAAYKGDVGPPKLTGGFGRRANPPRPVEVVAESGKALISNAHRPGEAAISRQLALR